MGEALHPIRDLNEVYRIAGELAAMEDERGRRMYLLWMVGVNMGLRVGDLICLHVGDLRADSYTYTPHKQRHKKGVRPITIPVPRDVREAVRERCAGMPDSAWLFQSRKKREQRSREPDRRNERRENVGAITRQTALRDMVEISRRCSVNMRIGCHTMRKTFGYHYYMTTKDLATLQKWFYHENPATTLIYIGVDFDRFKDMTDRSPFAGMGRQ